MTEYLTSGSIQYNTYHKNFRKWEPEMLSEEISLVSGLPVEVRPWEAYATVREHWLFQSSKLLKHPF